MTQESGKRLDEPVRPTGMSRSASSSQTEGNGADATAELELLREILLAQDRRQIAQIEAQLPDLRRRLEDRDALIATITPVVGDAIRQKIRDSRAEMVEALYPIIGQLVVRAVSEAVRDLARSIDSRMRTSLSPAVLWRRLRARLGGVSGAEMALRESLPFSVAEIFLIHRESGLLLHHLSRDAPATEDSDLVSGMLTAIRDFVQDAFGRGEEGQLDEIQYGMRRILIEATQHAYLAVVVEGVEPPGFRAEMRERIVAIEHRHRERLRGYDGDPAPFRAEEESLRSLLAGQRESGLTSTQKRVLAVGIAMLFLCVATVCFGSWWAWHSLRSAAAAAPVVVVTATPTPTLPATPTATPTLTPTPTATPTATPTPTVAPTATPTATPSPTATATVAPTATPEPTPTLPPRVVTRPERLNVRSGPGLDYPVVDVAQAGQAFWVLGQDESGQWLAVCCMPGGTGGWVFAGFVTFDSDLTTVPIVTPVP